MANKDPRTQYCWDRFTDDELALLCEQAALPYVNNVPLVEILAEEMRKRAGLEEPIPLENWLPKPVPLDDWV